MFQEMRSIGIEENIDYGTYLKFGPDYWRSRGDRLSEGLGQ